MDKTKTIDKVEDRFKVLVDDTEKAGTFYRRNFGALFAYSTNRIPEITDELYKIDDAMRAGFRLGPRAFPNLGCRRTG